MANLFAHRLAALSAHNGARYRSDQLGHDSQVGHPHGGVRVSTSRLADQPATEFQLDNSTQKVPESPLKVAIIVPYFQREAGILRRCLAAIFAQKLNPRVGLHVIVVDDSSPRPADEELRDIQIPERVTVVVVMRSNGGPAAARNSGLDHVSRGTDFVAFIDSDDTWRDDHIQRAVDALGTSNDLYVSDHVQWEGFSNLEMREFGAFVRTGQSSSLRPLAAVKGVWICPSTDIIPYAVKEVVAHTSSIVYRTSKLATCRFDEELWYGEDDLFLVDLLLFSTYTCVSAETEVSLGLGVNIFFSSISWDNENNLKRCCNQLILYKKVRRRNQISSELNETIKQIIRNHRPVLTFFIVRQFLKGKGVPLSSLVSLLQHDPQFFAMFPVNIVRATAQWVSGKLQGNPAFHQK
jgi:succinoglycan biosynthesis protein ExoW